jgi:hypothetical protein
MDLTHIVLLTMLGLVNDGIPNRVPLMIMRVVVDPLLHHIPLCYWDWGEGDWVGVAV